jgi:hypothetical protein
MSMSKYGRQLLAHYSQRIMLLFDYMLWECGVNSDERRMVPSTDERA